MYPDLISALITKLFLVVLLWLLLKDNSVRRKLRYYRIVGVSNLKFFSTLFILDCAITIPFLSLLKEFI